MNWFLISLTYKDVMRSLRMAERESVPAGGGSSPLLPGGLGISLPALSPACEVHRWMCHTGWRRTRLVRPVCHEAWPRLSLGMKYSHWQRAVVGRREASAQRSARAAPRSGAEVGYASLGVPLPCFLPFLHSWLKALIVRRPASTAGIL